MLNPSKMTKNWLKIAIFWGKKWQKYPPQMVKKYDFLYIFRSYEIEKKW
jgi:hypothetical protein